MDPNFQLLAPSAEPTSLDVSGVEPDEERSSVWSRQSRQLSRPLSTEIQEFCSRNNLSLEILLAAAGVQAVGCYSVDPYVSPVGFYRSAGTKWLQLPPWEESTAGEWVRSINEQLCVPGAGTGTPENHEKTAFPTGTR